MSEETVGRVHDHSRTGEEVVGLCFGHTSQASHHRGRGGERGEGGPADHEGWRPRRVGPVGMKVVLG